MTTTLDRIANINDNAFRQADKLWRSFQKEVKEVVNGNAKIEEPIKYRPNWRNVRRVIQGEKSVSSIEGCN